MKKKKSLPIHEAVIDELVDSKMFTATEIVEALAKAETLIIHHYCVGNPNELGEVEKTLQEVISPIFHLKNGIKTKMEERLSRLDG